MGVMIANVLAIFRKELQGYFASPLAYGVASIFWLLSGFFFVAILLAPVDDMGNGGIINRVAIQEQMGMPMPPIDVAYEFLRTFLSVIGSLMLYVLPILSMGLYAEERKRGTLELLATSPLTNWAVAVGKLLGVLTFFIFMLLPLIAYEMIALSAANPPVLPTVPLLGHVGLILFAASILSLGMFISSLTESTILAAFLTFGLNIFLATIDWVSQKLPDPIGGAIGHLSLLTTYDNFVKGIFDPSGLVLFASYIILGIFLTAQCIDALRFQRS
jgi:ABC-2 type transport system permease protein